MISGRFKYGRSVPPSAAVTIDFTTAMTSLPSILTTLGATFTRASTKRVWQGSGWTVLTNNQFGTGWVELDQKYGATFSPNSTNLLVKSEGTVSDATTSSNVSNTTMSQFDAAIAYGDNSVQRYWYKSLTAVSSKYTYSCFVQMDDGGAPVVGTNSTTGDFSLMTAGQIADSMVQVEHIYGTLYRVWGGNTNNATAGAQNTGVIKYTTQSSRSFKISGQQLLRADPIGYVSYIKTTGATASTAGDVLTFPTSGISGFTDTNTNYLEYRVIYPTTTERYIAANYRLAGVSGATATDYNQMGLSSGNLVYNKMFSGNSNVRAAALDVQATYVKTAISLNSITNRGYASLNGYFAVNCDFSVTAVPYGIDTYRVGNRMNTTLFAGDKIRIYNLKIFTQFLTQTQLNEITK